MFYVLSCMETLKTVWKIVIYIIEKAMTLIGFATAIGFTFRVAWNIEIPIPGLLIIGGIITVILMVLSFIWGIYYTVRTIITGFLKLFTSPTTKVQMKRSLESMNEEGPPLQQQKWHDKG